MATLFIANTSKQHHIFYWRDPDDGKRLRSMQIPAGGQMPVLRGATQAQIHSVIEQHIRYGLKSIGEATQEPGEFIGLCYSIDDPVTKSAIEHALEHNNGILKDRSDEMLEDAANAVKTQIDNAVGRPAQAVSVEMVEEGDDPKMAKGFEVLADTVSEETMQKVRSRRERRPPRLQQQH